MKLSPITWTDFSGGNANFVIRGGPGDCECSPGCQHCYALRMMQRWGAERVPAQTTIYPEKLQRLHTQQFPTHSPKRGAPYRPMVFVVDMGDLFHPAVPTDFILRSFEVMQQRSDVSWLVLTKRPERMAEVLYGAEGGYYLGGGDYVPNIWPGTTVESQEQMGRVDALLRLGLGWTLWVSVEPMLGPVYLEDAMRQEYRPPRPGLGQPQPKGTIEVWERTRVTLPRISWVVCGGESGPNRRAFDHAWAVDLYRQCREAGMPMFFKQGSGLFPAMDNELPGIGKVEEWPGVDL
jgi:protein gp37